MKRTSFRRAVAPAAALVALSLSLTACGGDDAAGNTGVSGDVVVDGSSTVYPMSNNAAQLLKQDTPKVNVAVAQSGTGGGFEKFCAGETDISDASRPIKTDEAAEDPACKKNGVEYTELHVATDALTVVVNPDLDITCLKVEELVKLLEPGSKITNWKQLNPAFPDQKVAGFIPGTDSGTYDYMAGDVVEHETEALRDDFQQSEDDNVLVKGVAEQAGAVSFFGYSYYEENQDKLKALEIDGGEGCVAPSADTARDGSYTPLARPLFIYVNKAKYSENKAVKAYVDYYVENLTTIAEESSFIALSDEEYAETKTAAEALAS